MGIAHPKPQPVTIHKPQWDHGVEQAQTKKLNPQGTFSSAKNAGAYKGCNSCWREGHGHEPR